MVAFLKHRECSLVLKVRRGVSHQVQNTGWASFGAGWAEPRVFLLKVLAAETVPRMYLLYKQSKFELEFEFGKHLCQEGSFLFCLAVIQGLTVTEL